MAPPFAAVTTRAAVLSEEACAARGGCDAYAELWAAMEAGDPVVLLDTPCSTRKARKQLLSRLGKQPVAQAYAWHALPDPDASNQPSVDEGWGKVL